MLKPTFSFIDKHFKIILISILVFLFCKPLVAAENVFKSDNTFNLLINRDYHKVKEIFNKELRTYKVNVPNNLMSLLREPFFLTEEIFENTLTKREELDYIRRTVIYKQLVKRLIRGLQSDRDIVFKLFDWTFRNISLHIREDVGAKINGFPYDYMLRGFGMCDRSAWVLATLAFQAGYNANVISMPNHAITQIYLEDQWALFDPHYGVIYKDKERLIGLEDQSGIKAVIKNNDIIHDNMFDNLMSSNIVTICEPYAIMPKMEILQNILDRNSDDPPRVYYDILGELSFSISTISSSLGTKIKTPLVVPYKFPGMGYGVMVWLFPFEIRHFHNRGIYNKNMEKLYADTKYCEKARELQIMGDFENAMDEYNKCLDATFDSGIKNLLAYNKAVCFYEIGEYDKARELFLIYKKDYPYGKEIRGVDYYLDRSVDIMNTETENNRKESLETDIHYRLKNLVRINTNNDYTQEKFFSCFCNLASIYKVSGQPDKAIELYKKAIVIKPDNGDANYMLGKLYLDKNNFNNAELCFLKANKSQPDNVDTHVHLALTFLKNNKKDKAIRVYRKALELNPNLKKVLYNLGVIYLEKGEWKKSQHELEKLLDIDPNHALAHYVISLAYYNDNNVKKSFYHGNKAKELGVKLPSETNNRIK